MTLLILSAFLNQVQIDWSEFERLINETIPVTKDLKSFREILNERIREFKKDHKVVEGELAYDVFKIQNSKFLLLRMGWFPAEGCMYVVRPSESVYSVEEVNGFSDFKAYYAVLDHDHLVLGGDEYSISNAKHPAVVSYRRRGDWVVAGVQVANFEGSVEHFVKRDDKWTCYAKGRTYPDHLVVPHSGAHVGMQRTFLVKNGELLTSRDQFYPSQMHTFDELIVWSQRKNWARVRSLCASDSVALKFRNLTKNIPVQKWAVIEEDGDTILKCRIPNTSRIAVMEKVGRGWQLTKIELFKDEN